MIENVREKVIFLRKKYSVTGKPKSLNINIKRTNRVSEGKLVYSNRFILTL